MSYRIGQGVDAHAFTAGDQVVLCGIRLPHERGVLATSDGDVALHALCDALLGAAALGDLGTFFPSDDPAWRGADSADLLRRVTARVAEAGLRLANADLTVICQTPRLGPHREEMRGNVARLLDVPVDAVSLKFTTTDGLGFTGRGEGLAAMAVVLLTHGN